MAKNLLNKVSLNINTMATCYNIVKNIMINLLMSVLKQKTL